MAWNEIENEVLRTIGENLTTPDVFFEGSAELDMLRGFINDSIQEICMISGCLRDNYILTTSSNKMFYRLNPKDGYISFIYFILDRSRQFKLYKAEVESLDLENSGPPSHYAVLGNQYIMLYPKPTSTYSLTINYCKIPYGYVSLRKDYERAVIFDTLSKYYAYNREVEKAGEYFKLALETAKLDSNLMPEVKVQFQGWKK